MYAKIIQAGRLPVRIRTQTGDRCIASHYDPGNRASKYIQVISPQAAIRDCRGPCYLGKYPAGQCHE